MDSLDLSPGHWLVLAVALHMGVVPQKAAGQEMTAEIAWEDWNVEPADQLWSVTIRLGSESGWHAYGGLGRSGVESYRSGCDVGLIPPGCEPDLVPVRTEIWRIGGGFSQAFGEDEGISAALSLGAGFLRYQTVHTETGRDVRADASLLEPWLMAKASSPPLWQELRVFFLVNGGFGIDVAPEDCDDCDTRFHDGVSRWGGGIGISFGF